MRLALLVLAGCGRIGFDPPGGGGDGGGPGSVDSLGSGPGAPTVMGSNGASSGAMNPTTQLTGVRAGDVVIMAVAYSGAMATIIAMEADGDLAKQVVSQTAANQIHIAMYAVTIGADHASETFGAVINPTANEAAIAVVEYGGAGPISGESSAEFSGSSTAQYSFLFAQAGSLAVAGLAAGAADTGASPGFTKRISVPGSLIRTLLIGDTAIAQGGSASASVTLASATDWAMGAIALPPN